MLMWIKCKWRHPNYLHGFENTVRLNETIFLSLRVHLGISAKFQTCFAYVSCLFFCFLFSVRQLVPNTNNEFGLLFWVQFLDGNRINLKAVHLHSSNGAVRMTMCLKDRKKNRTLGSSQPSRQLNFNPGTIARRNVT